jgi:hypothetical protein
MTESRMVLHALQLCEELSNQHPKEIKRISQISAAIKLQKSKIRDLTSQIRKLKNRLTLSEERIQQLEKGHFSLDATGV